MDASFTASAGLNVAVLAISSRPEAVSGGSVLVELDAPAQLTWSAQLNGHDVTAAFRPDEKSGRRLALLRELELGKNRLEIRSQGVVVASLDLIDHPSSGPVFSGVHQTPFICQTQANGLDPPLDSQCAARTRIQYYYKSTEPLDTEQSVAGDPAGNFAPGFKEYPTHDGPPADVARTVTSDGHTVPYIVRRETGTINRAVYDIQFLHRPGDPLPVPWTGPTPGWNGRLVYLVDGGCGAGYRQGTLNGAIGAANEPFLSQGYATATSTLNVAGNNCNDRISAETLSMVKEQFIKEYGAPVHTIGWGDSGGAIVQQLTAQNYPGLLNGIIPYLSFPDEPSTLQSVADCALLEHAFITLKQPLTPEQKTAISGFATWHTCTDGWGDGNGHIWPILTPDKSCPSLLPKDKIYDPKANPRGVRCDLYDNEINIFGRNPRTGTAWRPLDNAGVQYGLMAFNAGRIDAEQFVELNERIGGFDDDGNIVTTRMQADPEALRNAYRRGLVLTGGGGLREVPIIDWRVYDDDMANQHDRLRSFVTRARLVAANGDAGNHVILVYPRYSVLELVRFWSEHRYEVAFPGQARDLVRYIDRWLDAIAADTTSAPLSVKVAHDKPADLTDGCWSIAGEHVIEPASYGTSGRCNQMYPAYADPRIAAGGPLTDDVLKCQLKPVNATDYAKPLTDGQLSRLQEVFPTGVCDYTRPGIAHEVTSAVWEDF